MGAGAFAGARPRRGRHARPTFKHDASRRVLVAFRGTDLDNSTKSGRADACADRLLWGKGLSYAELPESCRREFDFETLDYLTAALKLWDRVRASLTDYEPLFVGHSLGAGLASLVAAAPKGYVPKALGLAGPAFDEILKARLGGDPAELPRGRILLLYNAMDPVYFEATKNGSAGLQGAVACPFPPPGKEPPPGCVACYNRTGPLGPDLSRPACEECFLHTHVLANYLHFLNGTKDNPPVARPACQAGAPGTGGRGGVGREEDVGLLV